MLSLLVELNSKASLLLGGFLNILLIVLIYKNTPKDMKLYSKLLIQTCIGDLANILIGDFVQPVIIKDSLN